MNKLDLVFLRNRAWNSGSIAFLNSEPSIPLANKYFNGILKDLSSEEDKKQITKAWLRGWFDAAFNEFPGTWFPDVEITATRENLN